MEKIEIRPSKKFSIIFGFFGCAFGALIAISTYFAFPSFICFILGLFEYTKRNFNLYTITDDSITHYWGFISSRTIIVPLNKVQRVDTEVSFFQRFFKLGNVLVESAAELQDKFSINMIDIDEPQKIQEILMSKINKKN